MKEELTEKGIVLKSENGVAEVGLSESDACKECSAKLFCSPSENKSKTITALDPYGVEVGDRVTISVSGQTVLKATILLYGIPLLILVGIIAIGLELFNSSSLPELYSFLLAVSGMGIYYLIFFLSGKRNYLTLKPARIISLTRAKVRHTMHSP